MIPAIGYTATVFVGGIVRLPEGSGPGGNDKLAHFAAFAAMSVLFARAGSELRPDLGKSRIAGLSLAASTAMGGALELIQAVLPYRGCEWQDWVADALGASLGAACFRLLPRRARLQ